MLVTALVSALLLMLLAFIIGRYRQMQIYGLQWPSNLSHNDFSRRCSAYLRRAGWRLSFEGQPNLDVRADRGEDGYFFLFRLSGEIPGEGVTSDLKNFARIGMRVVLVCLTEPSEEMAAFLPGQGIYVMHYTQLRVLDEIIHQPPSSPTNEGFDGNAAAPRAWGQILQPTGSPGKRT